MKLEETVFQGQQETEGTQVFQAMVCQGIQENLVPKVTKVTRGFLEHLAFLVWWESKETKVCLVTRDGRASREREAFLDPQWKGQRENVDNLGMQDSLVLRVVQASQRILENLGPRE